MPSDPTRAQARSPAPAGPADGPRARYDVQSSNRHFSYSSVKTGAHASVGVTGGRQDVEEANRQATGASDEAAVVCQCNHLSRACVASTVRHEGHRPFRLMRTLPFDARLS